VDDPLLSAVIDYDHLKVKHNDIIKQVEEKDWNNFTKYELEFENKALPINSDTLIEWINQCQEDSSDFQFKHFIYDLHLIRNNYAYQIRSPALVNESTFTHDFLASFIKFIAPKYIKGWDTEQSVSAKDERGVDKRPDVIGKLFYNNIFNEVFFIEVSYSPFHYNPMDHAIGDHTKLRKLGKNALDRNYRKNRKHPVFLIHLYSEYLYVYFMDLKYYPIVRKVLLYTIHIPLYKNTPTDEIQKFLDIMWKMKLMLDGIIQIYEQSEKDVDLEAIFRNFDIFETFSTPRNPKK